MRRSKVHPLRPAGYAPRAGSRPRPARESFAQPGDVFGAVLATRKAAVRLEARVLSGEALGGEVLLVGGAPRVPDQDPARGGWSCAEWLGG